MKRSRTQARQFLWNVLLLLAILLVMGCSTAIRPQLAQEEGGHNLLARLEHEAAAAQTNEEQSDTSEADRMTIEELLTELDYVPVQQIVASPSFYTIARTNQITQYPCSTCHIAPLATLQAEQAGETENAAAAKAHRDIVIDHADESVMNCTTCHNVDDPDKLHTLTGNSVEFDHSYQVCAQCHALQHEDWQGGAHGKRVGGWAPPRVVENCVECHNPHQPAWDIRWPAVTNTGSQE